MATLPNLVCLKSIYNNKYLKYCVDHQIHGFLQFAGESWMDPKALFEVVTATSFEGLVHLKSRYSDQYLARWPHHTYWISASANKPIEDKNSWACTLFKPIVVKEVNGKKQYRLLHVQSGHNAALWRAAAPFDSCLYAGSKDPDHDSCDLLTVFDWENIPGLPRRVAFKGDNGKFLGAQKFNNNPGLQFLFENPKDPKVVQQIFQTSDGTICIKSEYYGKFWSVGDKNWITVDVEDPRNAKENAGALFRLSIVGTNVVALSNVSLNWFVKRLTDNGRESSLSAATQNIDTWSRLEVLDVDI